MPLMNEHEIGFVSAFIIPERRERYLSLLGNPKRRGKAAQSPEPHSGHRFFTRPTRVPSRMRCRISRLSCWRRWVQVKPAM